MKILLVDDEDSIRRALIFALTRNGHQIKEAGHPLTALELLQQEHFDLLILDYRMSLLSGLDIAQIFRKTDRTTPIIMLTSQKISDTITMKGTVSACQILSKDNPLPLIVQQIENSMQKTINLT